MHHLGQLVINKQFTDLSNNTWQIGNPAWGKPHKGVNYYTTAEYRADPVNR